MPRQGRLSYPPGLTGHGYSAVRFPDFRSEFIMTEDSPTNPLRDGYDAVAVEYAERIFNELDHKPLDRELLARFAERVGSGPCCDLGCGPGHVARYLHGFGANVTGIDLSARMIELARSLNPGIEFRLTGFCLAGRPGFIHKRRLEPQEIGWAS